MCGAGRSAGSADGGKLRRWLLIQEAERGLRALFPGRSGPNPRAVHIDTDILQGHEMRAEKLLLHPEVTVFENPEIIFMEFHVFINSFLLL